MKEEDDECQEGSVAAQKRRTKTAWQTSFFNYYWDVYKEMGCWDH